MTYEIKKVITGHAYAKNGNLHNPTPRIAYFIYENGKLIGIDYKLRDAKQYIEDIRAGIYSN